MFSESLKEGEAGEHVIWNLLNKRSWVRSVVDVRADKNFQEDDIDFLVENTKRQFAGVEVKTDYKAHETGNLVYELSTSGNVGCFDKTKAVYIAYYVPGDKTVYFLDVAALRKYIYNEARPNEVHMGDNATGLIIPLEDIRNHGGIISRTFEGVV